MSSPGDGTISDSPRGRSEPSVPSPSSEDLHSRSSEDDSSVSRRWEPWQLDFPDRMLRYSVPGDSEESEDDSSTANFDPALNKHLLASASPSDKVLLPFLCMSDGNRIFDLLASAVYQRSACGIKGPLIGLTFDHGAPTVQLAIAWLEDYDTLDGSLPPVHVAFEDPCGLPPSLTLFNLCDPTGALRLASFLMSLPDITEYPQHHVSDKLEAPEFDLLAWRSDCSLEQENSSDPAAFIAGVTRWADNVAEALQSSDDHCLTAEQTMTKKSAGSKGPSLSSIKEGQPPQDDSTGPGLQAKDQSRRRTCSSFARGRKEEWGTYCDAHVSLWMADRSAILSGLFSATMNDAVERYEDCAAFRWPTQWDILGNMPPVNPFVEDLKEELFRAVQARQAHVAANLAPPALGITSEEMYNKLSSELSTILDVCRFLRASEKNASVAPITYEIAARSDWDRLVKAFMNRPSDGVFPLPERLLRFPKNTFAENNFGVEFKSMIRDQLLHLASPFLEALHANADDDLRRKHWRSYDGRRSALYSSWDDMTRDASIRRSLEEPIRGRCDNTCGLICPDFYPPKKGKLRKGHRLVVQTDPPLVDGQTGSSKVTHSSTPSTLAPPVRDIKDSSIFGSGRNQTKFLLPPSSNAQSAPKQPATDGPAPSQPSPASREPETPSPYSMDELEADLDAMDIGSELDEEEDDLSNEPQKSNRVKRDSRSLFAPILLVEYKKTDDKGLHTAEGVKQSRMYTVAASKFLANLGIYDFPVFGLVTDGTLGAVSCTYTTDADTSRGGSKSSYKDNVSVEFTYVAEADAHVFDISTPLGAFHFSTFLCMLAEVHARTLNEKLADVKERLEAMCRDDDPRLVWNAEQVRLAAQKEKADSSRSGDGA
ncbi:hypothetical protein GLOTRDRAFT_137917 [Gloeophyllum trabeum ATCC 11539]|uniref:Uncharacterized protein n=1 Tax=Gloeophyllum trabeum (strain ATCC 11539 / FP-39264 / Madison 617) TaxID=670483 RepID=S7QEC9_GLOTA|nr:uncharacterized protein GLOTRDRAFT_137917 [Gloeophyllum trabeum ATCC 11539]EPQ57658.1 hypothetical protein GLOTRDRAFT_137917 [Gloeophyllum trabeum ATCC 11539]